MAKWEAMHCPDLLSCSIKEAEALPVAARAYCVRLRRLFFGVSISYSTVRCLLTPEYMFFLLAITDQVIHFNYKGIQPGRMLNEPSYHSMEPALGLVERAYSDAVHA